MPEKGSKRVSPPRAWFAWFGLIVYIGLIIGIAHRATPYGSPDEAANAFFVHQQATSGQAMVQTDLTSAELAYAHPRSMVVQGNRLLSASFLGLVQVGGWAEHWFGLEASRLVVPVLSILAVMAFYSLLRRFWSPGWSWLGTALLAANPVWVQFQTLPMFHNGAFVSMLVITGYCLRRQFERPSWRWAAAVGVAYGLALYFRPVEVFWTGPLIAIVLLTMPGRWKWFPTVVIVTAIIQLPWLLADRSLYGSVLATGYTPESPVAINSTSSLATSLNRLLTPPGGWSLHFLSSAWWYFFLLLPANSALAVSAMVIYFRRKFVDWHKIVKLGLVSLLVVFPLAYYGSWDLYPLLPASNVGSLSSYSRYWLPLYLAMIPGMVLILKRLVARPVLLSMVVIVLLGSQIVMIGWHPGSGLAVRWQRQDQAVALRTGVLDHTPASAVIIAGQADKYLVDQRLTGSSLPTTETQWTALRSLVTDHHVFILQSAAGRTIDQLRSLLASHHLALSSPVTVTHDQLWQVIPS